jgi:hypothetical protein
MCLKKNEVLSIVCVYICPPKVDKRLIIMVLIILFFFTFSSLDLKTPTKPKQVLIFGLGVLSFFFNLCPWETENIQIKLFN